MKVIDVFIAIHNNTLPSNFKFEIDDDRYTYFLKDGYLYFQKYNYEPEIVEWQIYQEWLDKDIKVLGDDEK